MRHPQESKGAIDLLARGLTGENRAMRLSEDAASGAFGTAHERHSIQDSE